MTLWQIIIVVVLVYLTTSILFIFALPSVKKNEIDKPIENTLTSYRPKEKRFYFGIHYFNSGWSEAKKSPQQFIRFVILSPLIFISWLLWLFFKRDIPPDFERSFPPPHPGGRTKGKRNKQFADLDDELIKLMVEKKIDFDPAFWELRHKYWEKAYPNQQYINPDKLNKTIKPATKRRIDTLLLTKN
jgi:hypothetical protein